MRVFEDNFILLKPKVDASDKQIFSYNNYRTNADYLMEYINNQGTTEKIKVFRPEHLGEAGNNYAGNKVWLVSDITEAQKKPDYALTYLLDKRKRIINDQQSSPAEMKAQEEKQSPKNEPDEEEVDEILDENDKSPEMQRKFLL